MDILNRQAHRQEQALEYVRARRRSGATSDEIADMANVYSLVTSMPVLRVWELIHRDET